MRIRLSIHGVLILDSPTTRWFAWCPELDVATQGDHPDHAAAMLEEACRIVVEDCVEAYRFDESGEDRVRKRIIHPERLGSRSSEADEWPIFKKMREAAHRNSDGSARLDSVALMELSDGLDPHILVSGSLTVESRSGVNKVDVWLSDFGEVEVEEYVVQYRQAYERKTSVSVRKSMIAAGVDPRKVALEEVGHINDSIGPFEVSKR